MLKPTADWIVTKKLDLGEKVSPGGIYLPKAKEATKLVQIISFGPEANPHNLLKVGDVIVVPSNTGMLVTHNDDEYEFAKEGNFLGVME